jgi:hypothetical protein
MSRGATRKRAERAASGYPRRQKGTAKPIIDPDTVTWGMVPAGIKAQLPPEAVVQTLRDVWDSCEVIADGLNTQLNLVITLRQCSLSWDSIGWFFGVTGEAVRRRFGPALAELEVGGPE